MFSITISRKQKTVTAPVQQSAKPKLTKAQRKAEPMTPRQIGTLSRMLRQYGLVDEATKTAIVGSYTFVYDDAMIRIGKGGVETTGGWRGFEQLTKSDADVLFALFGTMAKPGFSPVTTSQAETAPAPAPKTYGKGDVVTIDGVEYRIAGKAR